MGLVNNFSNRYGLSQELSVGLNNLFNKDEVELIPFGFETISNGSNDLNIFINSAESNLSHSAMLVKFAPDFILFKKNAPQEIYFWEIKVSVTPLWSAKNFNEIKFIHPDIKLSDVGIVAREAWNAYKTLFPNTIILSATTYNPNILKAQFVNNIKCLRCNGINGKENCSSCPIEQRGFFELSRNYAAEGSQTQHTNLDLSSFLGIEEFFKKLDINIDNKYLTELIDSFKKHGVHFPSSCYDIIKNKIVNQLRSEGCDWL